MKRILIKTAMLALPALTLLSLHLLTPPDAAAQVRSRRSIATRPHRRTNTRRTTRRDAVFIGGGAATGAIIGRKRRNSIIAGGLGTGAIRSNQRRSSTISGTPLGAGVGGRTRRQNSAIGAGGAGTYRKARRIRGSGRN